MNPLEDNVSGQSLSPNSERIVGIDFTPLNTPVASPDGPTVPIPPTASTIGANVVSIGVDSPQITIAPNYNLFTSSTAPANDFGNDGDWYWMIIATGIIRIYHKVDCIWVLVSQTPGTGTGCPDGCPAGGDLSGTYLNPLVRMVHYLGEGPDSGLASITVDDNSIKVQPTLLQNSKTLIDVTGITLSSANHFSGTDIISISPNSVFGVGITITNGATGDFISIRPDNGDLVVSNASNEIFSEINQSVIELHDNATGDTNITANNLQINTVDGSQFNAQSNALDVSDGPSGRTVSIGTATSAFRINSGLAALDIFMADLVREMGIREIDVCDSGVAKKMLIIGSDPY